MSQKFKADLLLEQMTDADRAAYKKLCESSTVTYDEKTQFFLDRGFQITRTAVWKHGKNLEEKLARIRERSEWIGALGEAVKASSPEDVAENTIRKMQQDLFAAALEMENQDLTPKDWAAMTQAAKNLVSSNAENKRLVRELEEQRRKAADAVKAAQAAAAGGKSGAAVVDAIKKALGITGEAA